MMFFVRCGILFLFFGLGQFLIAAEPPADPNDPYGWLEEIESPKALEWVKAQSDKTIAELETDPRYAEIQRTLETTYNAKDKLVYPSLRVDGYVHHFLQDADHVKGIWRRIKYEDYLKNSEDWEILLDIDALAKKEGRDWVYKGGRSQPVSWGTRTLISLSEGGKDASIVREYDYNTKEFVADGFELPESLSNASWLSPDTLILHRALNSEDKTKSGYPRKVVFWKRGSDPLLAKEIFSVEEADLSVNGWAAIEKGVVEHVFVGRQIDFYQSEIFWVKPSGEKVLLPMPKTSSMLEGKKDIIYFQAKKTEGPYKTDSIYSIDLTNLEAPAKLVYSPPAGQFLNSFFFAEDRCFVVVKKDVVDHLYEIKNLGTPQEEFVKLSFGGLGTLSVWQTKEGESDLFVSENTFLNPPTVYRWSSETGAVQKIRSAKERADLSNFVVEQLWTTSKDGTKIPYFLIRPNQPGPYPTWLYGYGGFEHSLNPYYIGGSKIAHGWLKYGGAFVFANIRGGSEFGPEWHSSVLKENRQKVFDDFAAIAKDLIARGMTTSDKLAIEGGSNGGLLVGTSFTQNPELFKCVLCEVPLLDMLRYHLLLRGDSWSAEYGTVDEPGMREVLEKYSPYQNIPPVTAKTAEVLFLTSTKDDRVHPGHARKMAARMLDMGHKVLLLENEAGGHAGAADYVARSKMDARLCAMVLSRLMPMDVKPK